MCIYIYTYLLESQKARKPKKQNKKKHTKKSTTIFSGKPENDKNTHTHTHNIFEQTKHPKQEELKIPYHFGFKIPF